MINRNDPRHVKSFLRGSRARRRRRIRKYFRIGLFIVFLITCFVGFIHLSKMDKFQLKEVKVNGTHKLDNGEIENFVKKISTEKTHIFGLVPSTSMFFIGEGKLEKAILGKYPRISEVNIDSTYSGNINIEIKERLGKSKWCTFISLADISEGVDVENNSNNIENMDTVGSEGENEPGTKDKKSQIEPDESEPKNNASIELVDNSSASSSVSASNIDNSTEVGNLSIGSNSQTSIVSSTEEKQIICYEFDKDGYIFDQIIMDKGISFDQGVDNLTIDTTQTTEFRGLLSGNPIGQKYLDEYKLNTLSKIIQFLAGLNLKDEYIDCQTTELCTIKIYGNGKIHIDITHNPESLTDRLKAVLENTEIKGKQFNYIDSRYGNKVFYKL